MRSSWARRRIARRSVGVQRRDRRPRDRRISIPVITGIGHEVDTSIADLVADYQPHTPTEAAQVIVAHWRNRDAIDMTAARAAGAAQMRQPSGCQATPGAIERHEIFRRPMDRINRFGNSWMTVSACWALRSLACSGRRTRWHRNSRAIHGVTRATGAAPHPAARGVQPADELSARSARTARISGAGRWRWMRSSCTVTGGGAEARIYDHDDKKTGHDRARGCSSEDGRRSHAAADGAVESAVEDSNQPNCLIIP